MAKVQNTFMGMVLSLTVIAVVVGALLGYVNSITEKPIAKAKEDKEINAIAAVSPVEGAEVTATDSIKLSNGTTAIVKTLVKDGQTVGHAIKVTSKKGFGGNIEVMFGVDAKLNICGYNVLDCSQETPGLGAKMPDWFQKDAKGDVIGKNLNTSNLTVKQDNGEVDAITAATISSRAFCDAMAMAKEALGKTPALCAGDLEVAEPACCGQCPEAEACCGKCQDEAACEGACEKAEGCCGKCQEGETPCCENKTQE